MPVQKISTPNYDVEIGSISESSLSELLLSADYKMAKYFILVDENSLQYCYPYVLSELPFLESAEILEIESGETNKNIEICTRIWQAITALDADRDSVIINLGGGVITDMGGFIAGLYKRGIRFINIPTTLLAQVDASVGGKTGIDLDHLKNQIGLFNYPELIVLDPFLLKTLPKREVISGYAEMIKHALIADKKYWEQLKKMNLSVFDNWAKIIQSSVEIKNDIVSKDPSEKGLRKILNFGHTIGHAIESFSLENGGKELLHGEAVAVGMVCEAYLSYKNVNLPKKSLEEIIQFISTHFEFYPLEEITYHRILELMKNDKKNKNNQINFTLLNEIGSASIDHYLNASDIKEALAYYRTAYEK